MKSLLLYSALALTAVGKSSTNKKISRSLHSKRDVNGSYIETNAPRVNIFAGISSDESQSIIDFLTAQANLTVPGDLNFASGPPAATPWLLAPNKTAATSYLDGRGAQPARFARLLGSSYGDGNTCYIQEWMVGPLPVSNATKAMPLNYVNSHHGAMYYPCDTPSIGSNGTNITNSSTHPARRSSDTKRESKVERRSELYRRDHEDAEFVPLGWNGDVLPHDDISPPITILPDGARHEFDPDQNYVSWMDFTFMIGTGPAGVALYDVRYKGERIIYELGMQEALAHYAGPDLDVTTSSYLDVTIGFTNFNLIPGYDCPAYATYTDAFCLFEYPKDTPINRHQEDYYHATKNIAFLVRSVSTVGNYDYQTTYEFYYDGSIQTIVRASGYIQGSDLVNTTEAWDYGFHILDDLSGAMHDHVLNFKLDMDIHGTNNSLFKTQFVPHQQVYDWSNGAVVNTMKIERSFVTNEDQGKINWAPNSAAAYAVINKDKQNALGEYPGFRVSPSLGASIHLTVENSSVFSNAVNWATHQLYAVQRHDSEPVSAHPGNDINHQSPVVDFNDFFNSESLDQQDIVLYFNLGMHHLPDTYDLPNTVMTGSQSGIMIRPQNYLTGGTSMSTRQQVHITSPSSANSTDTDTESDTDADVDANSDDESDAGFLVNTYGTQNLSGYYDLANANPPWFPNPAFIGGGLGNASQFENTTDSSSR